jgi:hypothetical protein
MEVNGERAYRLHASVTLADGIVGRIGGFSTEAEAAVRIFASLHNRKRTAELTRRVCRNCHPQLPPDARVSVGIWQDESTNWQLELPTKIGQTVRQ